MHLSSLKLSSSALSGTRNMVGPVSAIRLKPRFSVAVLRIGMIGLNISESRHDCNNEKLSKEVGYMTVRIS